MSREELIARTRSGPFWRGVAAGLGLAAVGIALAGGVLTRRVVEVTIPVAALSREVEEEMRQVVRLELPSALAAVQAELPRQLAAEA